MSFIAKAPLSMPEISTSPSSPIEGTRGIFAKSDGLYEIDSNGNEEKLAKLSDIGGSGSGGTTDVNITKPEGTNGIINVNGEDINVYDDSGIRPIKTVITLYNDDWDAENTLTVNVEGVTKNNVVIISPVPTQDNITYYQANGVWCFAQGNETLSFMRNSGAETDNLYVNVLIYPESEETE